MRGDKKRKGKKEERDKSIYRSGFIAPLRFYSITLFTPSRLFLSLPSQWKVTQEYHKAYKMFRNKSLNTGAAIVKKSLKVQNFTLINRALLMSFLRNKRPNNSVIYNPKVGPNGSFQSKAHDCPLHTSNIGRVILIKLKQYETFHVLFYQIHWYTHNII